MKQRILTAVIAGVPFIFLIVLGGIPFTVLIVLLALIAMSELLKMMKYPYFSPISLFGFLLMLVIVLPDDWYSQVFPFFESKFDMLIIALLLLLMLTVVSKNKIHFHDAAFVFLSALYVGVGFYFFHLTRAMDNGLPLFFFVLFNIWATDSGAYFIGRTLGKRKLWPEISPKKTVEGAIGGIASALVLTIIFQLIHPLFSFPKALLAASIIAVFGQMGDLVESALKRHYGVKDSGNMLPGHGGILDRFDSLIFVLPILHVLQLV